DNKVSSSLPMQENSTMISIESIDDDEDSKIKDNINGTLVVYVVKPINETCIEPKFYIRVIYANGTIETSIQTYPVPEFNFCQVITKDKFTVIINRLLPKYALMVYMNSTDIKSSANYGILLTQNGEFISEFYIDKSSSINGVPDGPCTFAENGNFDGEFLMSNFKTNSNDYQWIHFTKLKTGIITQAPFEYGNTILYFSHFPILDGATITENNNSTKNIKPNQPPISIYVSLIYPDKDEIVGPFLIYQTTDVYLSIDYLICASALTSSRFMCAVSLAKVRKPKIYSNGAVTGTGPLEFNHIPDFSDSYLTILFYGGFLFNVISPSETYKNKYTAYGYLLDNDLKINATLDLPSNLTLPPFSKGLATNRNYGIFTQNNTFIEIIPNKNNNKSWNIISTKVPRFLPDDKGYSNPNIDSTYPPINGVIEIGSKEINVTYNTPFVPSINSISIYQINNDDQNILRQSFSADSPYCKISDDKKSMTIQVLTSTLNLSNTSYFVVIGDGALKKSSTNQPLMGIRKNIWKFTTTNGILRLNVEGTNLFNNLDSTNKSKFIKNLKNGLANLTPIDPTRLNFIKDQMDYTTLPPTLLLSFGILKSNNSEEINVSQVIDNLNTLIKNKFITGISIHNHTKFIDENHGFTFTSKEQINIIQGNNIVILKMFLILIDFMLDIAFIFNNGKNVPQLFIPSHYTNIKCRNQCITILSSKAAGLKSFSAPFSPNSSSLIFWCSLLNFFIEDVPQFIIQVIYKYSIISYDLIPFLTLITSSVIIANNIITRLYNIIINIKDNKVSSSSPMQEKSTVISIVDDEDNKIKDNISKLIGGEKVISRHSV
ncbi:11645_t:CDS:10, partial [Entrophospora sp. SA101]